MKDTYVTVSGVVATVPRAVVIDGSLPVTSFRLASTSRRFDSSTKGWVDGHTVWVTVTCWRELALNVAQSIAKKDLVVVHGRLRTPEWTGDAGVRRSGVEIDAESVGHDLAHGTAQFTRAHRVETLEVPGRREADALARAVEMEAMTSNLAALLGPEDDEFADGEFADGELDDSLSEVEMEAVAP